MDLSIIIPSFNTKKLLTNCLSSVFKETKDINYEVIVVDNASTDDSVNMVKEKFPQVKLITNAENVGYGRANNQGVKKGKGKYFLFLNSDTIILDKAIEKAVNFIKKRENVDILGCQLLNKDKSIQASAGFFPYLTRVFNWMVFIDELPLLKNIVKPYQQSRKGFYQKTRQLDWVTGAFLLVKREVINKITGFDEKFFMYAEEVDFCFRAKQVGFKVWFYPDSKIVHLKGKSSVEGFKTAVLGEYQGLKKFYQKHKPKYQLPFLKLLLKIGALLRIFIFGILKRDKYKKEIYEKAFKMA